MRDCLITWDASIYCIGPGFQVYDSFLGEFPKSHGNTVDEHSLSSLDEKLVRKDHPDFRGHATSMCP